MLDWPCADSTFSRIEGERTAMTLSDRKCGLEAHPNSMISELKLNLNRFSDAFASDLFLIGVLWTFVNDWSKYH
jgi:hypothetical protein